MYIKKTNPNIIFYTFTLLLYNYYKHSLNFNKTVLLNYYEM